MAAIDRAKAEVRNQVDMQFGGQIDQLTQQVDEYRNRIVSLESQANTIRSERNELSTRLAAVENGGGGLPIVGAISLAVLAGAAAGFAMAWLAGRPGPTPKVALSPAPRGVDPA